MMPTFGIKSFENELYINYYGESDALVKMDEGKTINIHQSSNYPQSRTIEMTIIPEKSMTFSLNLRIPEWSTQTKVKVNGVAVNDISPGSYRSISRTWNKNDNISIELDMRGRLHQSSTYEAITRGPIVLARDSRFDDGFVDETAVIQNEDGIVSLTHVNEKPAHIWLAFTAPCKIGTDLEGNGSHAKAVKFCDFASAGNTWDSSTRYRVWIPKTLNVMNRKYEGY